MPQFRFAIDVPILNHWDNVELLRMSVQSCLTAVLRDVDGSETLAMVTGELVENAIKYGAWPKHDGGAFRLRVEGENGHAIISVDNPVNQNDAGVARLFETLRWLEQFPSHAEAYRQKVLEVSKMPRGSATSGLGLVRIAYEADCVLAAEVENDMLRVSARVGL
jgi:two-component sensor histidine kinase